jgi:hypothetical protein
MPARQQYARAIAIVELVIAVALAILCLILLKFMLFPAPPTHWEGSGAVWAAIGFSFIFPVFAAFAIAGVMLLKSTRGRWLVQILPLAAVAWLIASLL